MNRSLREREIVFDDVVWRVREIDTTRQPGARGARCLVFDADGIVRRVWLFSESWLSMSDAAVGALMEQAVRVPLPAAARAAIAASNATLHPAVAAAAHALVVADELLADARLLREESRHLRAERDRLLESCRMRRDDMRAAIQGYVGMLKHQGVSEGAAVHLVVRQRRRSRTRLG